MPAIHNEILSDEWAVGLKFFLPSEDNKSQDNFVKNIFSEESFVIGITSDTRFYDKLLDEYGKCDILITHLGDINFKELISFADLDLQPKLFLQCLTSLKEYDAKELPQLKQLAASLGVKDNLKLKDSKAIRLKLKDSKTIQDVYKLILEPLDQDAEDQSNHLGFKGINSLAKKMAENESSTKLLIITEFPEYLSSFRKIIAESLNDYFTSKCCFTGDINLQIKIDINENKKSSQILCNKCDRDNDIPHPEAFHNLADIQETCVKASDECIVYYCREHGLDPEEQFINKITF